MCANPETTTIQIRVETWQALNGLKTPSDTFDDVIRELYNDSGHGTIATTEPQNAREQVSIPDSVPDRFDEAEVREVIDAAIDLIQSNDGASMREIVTTVGQDHPLDYEIPDSLESGERYRGVYWRKILKPALSESDQIRKPKPHESEWQPV